MDQDQEFSVVVMQTHNIFCGNSQHQKARNKNSASKTHGKIHTSFKTKKICAIIKNRLIERMYQEHWSIALV